MCWRFQALALLEIKRGACYIGSSNAGRGTKGTTPFPQAFWSTTKKRRSKVRWQQLTPHARPSIRITRWGLYQTCLYMFSTAVEAAYMLFKENKKKSNSDNIKALTRNRQTQC